MTATFLHQLMEMTRFEEEIQTLMLNPAPEDSPAVTGTSFTDLLGLASNHSLDLLQETLAPPIGCCLPIFPADAKLVERAARFSVFSSEESPEVSNSGEISSAKIKMEMEGRSIGKKRKGSEKSKLKVSTKKSKKAEENNGGEKLPFVHVRARRGQATDSHSLAERARREKINARMKLLQELVPGCSKITGTALVLDEIINHVQSLQRQVEFLSMRLAAVYPTMDFNGLDSFLSTECGGALAYVDGIVNNGGKQQQHQQQMWIINSQQQQVWERDDTSQSHVFVSNLSTTSNFSHDSSNPKSVSLPNQLKTEPRSS